MSIDNELKVLLSEHAKKTILESDIRGFAETLSTELPPAALLCDRVKDILNNFDFYSNIFLGIN